MDRRKSLSIYTRLSNLNDIWILMQLADICHRQGIQISFLRISYLFAARTDRLFSFNEVLDLELVKKMSYLCTSTANSSTGSSF